jgi:hypothetical protein
LDDSFCLEGIEISAVKQPTTIGKWVDAVDFATFGGHPEGLGIYLKIRCGLGQIEPLEGIASVVS